MKRRRLLRTVGWAGLLVLAAVLWLVGRSDGDA